MRVLSLLAPSEFSQLRRASPESWVVRRLDLRGVLAELATQAGGVVVLDPTDVTTGAFDALLAGAARAGARMVLCGEPLELGARALVGAADRADIEVLSTSVGDAPTHVRALVALRTPSIPMRVLRLIGHRLLRLPHRCASAMVRLFTFGQLPGSVSVMYASLELNQTTVGDCHRDAEICCPSRLLMIARVTRACHHAAQGNDDLYAVAQTCGFKGVRSMSRATEAMLGMSYRSLLRDGPPESAPTHLAAFVLRTGR